MITTDLLKSNLIPDNSIHDSLMNNMDDEIPTNKMIKRWGLIMSSP